MGSEPMVISVVIYVSNIFKGWVELVILYAVRRDERDTKLDCWSGATSIVDDKLK